MTKEQVTTKKPCNCGCGGKGRSHASTKMRPTDKENMEQALKDESSYLHKNLGK